MKFNFKRKFRKFRTFMYRFDNLKWWIIHRTYDRYNKVEIKSLPPGYYDVDKRLIHSSFDLLVQFVEEELAHSQFWWMEEEKTKIPWYMTEKQYVKKHAQELGLRHLDWEMSLTMKHTDRGENIPESGLQINHEGTQGWCAKEKKEIYLWYKNNYLDPHRLDPIYYPGLPYEEREQIEKDFDKEEEDMLIRLIKIRRSLWT